MFYSYQRFIGPGTKFILQETTRKQDANTLGDEK
jgi:hypothetical protein